MHRVTAIAIVLPLLACTPESSVAVPTVTSATVQADVATTSTALPASTSDSPPESAYRSTTVATTTTAPARGVIAPEDLEIESFPVPPGSRPHDVAPAVDGGVWYTGQGSGELGWLDPETGRVEVFDLGAGSRPRGVITAADGTAWITDGGRNSIIAFEPASAELTEFPLPPERPNANLNTATFDGAGILWFTGQNGVYGSLDPGSGEMVVYDAPRGRGPYGIATTPAGSVYLASLAGSYVGAVQDDGSLEVLEPPTPGQGARRVWSDSKGAIWVSEWNSGNVSRYVPATGQWTTWPLPGDDPATYAVYVDDMDVVWLSDFAANAMVRFDPSSESFTQLRLPSDPGDIRQILGRPGEVWGAESAADSLILIRTTR